MSNLAKRLIFAFTAMPLVAFLLWFGDCTRIAFVLFLNAVAAYEWAKMINAMHTDPSKFTAIISPFCAIALSLPWLFSEYKSCLPLVVTMVIFFYITIAFKYIDIKNLFPFLVLHIAGPLYIGLWGAISFTLFGSGQGFEQCAKFMVVMTTFWACDSFAYFCGRFFGKHKFSPQISPKKTWEGAVGGTIFSIFWFWIWTSTGFGYTVFDISIASTIVLAFVISSAGQIGDLLISALKRWSNTKDSGGIFPGHGGVLDRADSFYLAAPIATILLGYL